MRELKLHTMAADFMKLCGDFNSAIDVGPGIRPVFRDDVRVLCVEPSAVYADILEKNGQIVHRGTALDSLPGMKADVVIMLDVLEHMDKDDGLKVLELIKNSAWKMAVVMCPRGKVEQTTDSWGLGEHYWQTHRSQWQPEEFVGWDINNGFIGSGIVATYRHA